MSTKPLMKRPGGSLIQDGPEGKFVQLAELIGASAVKVQARGHTLRD